jgi:mannitol/fructose-specific phosphotransferase system IIA component (Ntr-type)
MNELLDMLAIQGKLLNHDTALKDLLIREQAMSTGIPNGIALPHAKTTAVQELAVAIGIKKSGVDFDSALDDKTRIIILALAPPEKAKPLYQFLGSSGFIVDKILMKILIICIVYLMVLSNL